MDFKFVGEPKVGVYGHNKIIVEFCYVFSYAISLWHFALRVSSVFGYKALARAIVVANVGPELLWVYHYLGIGEESAVQIVISAITVRGDNLWW